jgi:S1-C subfamily serine protease
MIRARFATLVAFIVFAAPVWGLALTPQMVEHAKKATALVELRISPEKKAFGSAFCIDASGMFVTNAHVVADVDVSGKINLILSPGETDQKVVEAKVLKSDKELDLAVLQIASLPGLAVLEMGDVSALEDTMDVTALGYPFGGALAMEKDSYPSVSVNTGHITSMRKVAGVLELLQVDAVLNPGNSGGPVLNGAGQVIGIVQAGLPGAGINFAIPANRLQKLLGKALVTLFPGSIPYESRAQPQQLIIKIVSLVKNTASYRVELTIRAGGAAPRTYIGEAVAGICPFTITPVPKPAATKTVLLSARFASGSITGIVTARDIKIGTELVGLDAIQRIEHFPGSPNSVVHTIAGKELSGRLTGLESANLNMGDASVTIDLTRALSMEFESPTRPAKSVAYTVAVTAKGELIGQAVGVIDLTGAPQDAIDVAVAPGPAARNTAAIDLMAIQRTAREGKWQVVGRDLVSSGRGKEILALGYLAPEEYDLSTDFTRRSGDEDIALILQANGSTFMFVMGGWHNQVIGAETAAGRRASDLPESIKGQNLIPLGQRNHLVLKVRKDGMEAILNGTQKYQIKTNFSGWGLNDDWKTASGRTLGLITMNSSVAFHSLSLTAVTGKGKIE